MTIKKSKKLESKSPKGSETLSKPKENVYSIENILMEHSQQFNELSSQLAALIELNHYENEIRKQELASSDDKHKREHEFNMAQMKRKWDLWKWIVTSLIGTGGVIYVILKQVIK